MQQEAQDQTTGHPNLLLLGRFDPRDPGSIADVFSEDAVWHFFNPLLPEIQGDYIGHSGIRTFFEKIAARTNGTFEVHPVSATPAGDELVVVRTRNRLTFDEQAVEVDVVIVWRFVDGRATEVWDIPSIHTMARAPGSDREPESERS